MVNKYYIKPEEFEKAVVGYQNQVKECRAIGKPIPQQPDILGRLFFDLCNNLTNRYNFNQYSFKDIMRDEAIENCIKAVLKFDPTKCTNIFNYFTTIAWQAFQYRILIERKENVIKHKNYQRLYHINTLHGEAGLMNDSDNIVSNRLITEYEDKLKEKALLKVPVVKVVKKKRKKRR